MVLVQFKRWWGGFGADSGNGIQTTANDTSIQKTSITTGVGGDAGSSTGGGWSWR